MAKLIVIRKSSFFGAIIGINIFVDNENIGSVRNGKSIEINISAGTHVLKGIFKGVMGNKCNEFTIDVLENETKTVFIGPPLPYWLGVFLPFMALLVFRDELQPISHLERTPYSLVTLLVFFVLLMLFRKKLLLISEF